MTRLNLQNSRNIILICNAITNKKLIRFTYNGIERLVEPYVIGQHTTSHNYLIRGWECTGGELEKSAQFRKLFTIDKMSDLQVEDNDFRPRKGQFNTSDKNSKRPNCSLFTDVMPSVSSQPMQWN